MEWASRARWWAEPTLQERSILRREAVAVNGAGLAELDAARVELAGVLAGAVDAGARTGQGLEAGRGDGLAAEATALAGGGRVFGHASLLSDSMIKRVGEGGRVGNDN